MRLNYIKNYIKNALNFILISPTIITKCKKLHQSEKVYKEKGFFLSYEFQPFNLENLYLMLCYSIVKKKNIIIHYYNPKKKINDKISDYCIRIFFFFLDIKFVHLVNYCERNNLNKKQIKIKNLLIKKVINDKSIIKLKYKNYKIGKYIYQTFYRNYFLSEANKKRRIVQLINDAILYVDNAENFINKYKLKKLICSHAVYLKYASLCMVGKKKNCNVSLFFKSHYYEFLKFCSLDKTLFPDEDYYNFNKNFNKIKNKRQAYNYSERALKAYLTGKKNNPRINKFFYNKKIINLTMFKKERILVYPPCFFDAVLAFNKHGLYNNPYDWMCDLLKHATKTNFHWFVKPHPQGLQENEEIYEKLKKKFPKIIFLDKNTKINYSDFKSLFTFQTTGIFEFLYRGVPVVIANDNHMSSFDFGKPEKNLKKFHQKIYSANMLEIKNKIKLKKDILKFYYMFNFGSTNQFFFKFLNKQNIYLQKYKKQFSKHNDFFYNYAKFNLFIQMMNTENIIKSANIIETYYKTQKN